MERKKHIICVNLIHVRKRIIRQTPIRPIDVTTTRSHARWALSGHLMDTNALFRTALFVMTIRRVYTIQPAKKLTNVYTTWEECCSRSRLSSSPLT